MPLSLLPEIVHKHRVQRSASMIDIRKSIQNTAVIQYAKTLLKRREGTTSFVRHVIIIQNLIFVVVFIDKSDRFVNLPYTAVTKMVSVREPFRPDQSKISTKIMAQALTSNNNLLARISGNQCSYMN
jgi:hypothetical protein